MQLRHGNPRILLQDHNITAESIHRCCTTADNTLLLAPGLRRLTPDLRVRARARAAVSTCFYLIDHQKAHFLMPGRRDQRLIQTLEFGGFFAVFRCMLQTSESPSSISQLAFDL